MEKCPCNSTLNYSDCCEPFLINFEAHSAPTALALMRSRYTAYALGFTDYIVKTHHPEKRENIDTNSIQEWSTTSQWNGLSIIKAEEPSQDQGHVEFIAHYGDQQGKEHHHHELSHFVKIDGRWYYSDGEMVKQNPIKRSQDKIGRNEICQCGSGKKFKKCCGR